MSALPRTLLPDTAEIDGGRLTIGGCDVVEVAERFGTPLFVYDEAHLRARCREARQAFGEGVSYATKAFLCRAMAALAHEEGLHLDVSTGGEMHMALAAGVPGSHLIMHGNNKSSAELSTAIDAGAGRIVVDSFDELDRLEALHRLGGAVPRVLIRVNPGVEAHTHEFVRTGQADSKFGFGLQSGAAQEAVDRAGSSAAVDLVGLHAHIGSQIYAIDSFSREVEALAPFVRTNGLPELSVGGGLGVAYVEGESELTITEWADEIHAACHAHGVEARVTAEPGRAISASAAITVYTVGTIKEIPGIRTYVSIDGGMSDNPRPILYGSGYETFVPRAADADRPRTVTVVGKHCESGDVLVQEANVPDDLTVGDLLATPVTGAYAYSMGSNYNLVPRPPVVFAHDGEARLVVRRETYDDLLAYDLG